MAKGKNYYDFNNICNLIDRENKRKETALRNYERQKAYKERLSKEKDASNGNENCLSR